MKFVSALVMLTLFLIAPSGDTKCDCRSVESTETTRAGGNEWVAYKDPSVYRKMAGKVRMPLPELQEDVLVEIFDNPDYLLCEWTPGNPNNCTMNASGGQRRLAACKTGKDGKFCFNDLPAGNYELRVSKDKGWSPTHVYIRIDPQDPNSTKKKPIEVSLKIGI